MRGGIRSQYGSSISGTEGMAPTLGAAGSMMAGSNYELRVTGALGGSIAFPSIGSTSSSLQNWPVPGATGLALPDIFLQTVALSGPFGVGGAGALTMPFTIPPALSGNTFYHQVFVLDPDGTLGVISHTNGLEVRYP